MKAATVIGVILVIWGVVLLVYETSPVRLMLQAVQVHRPDLVRPIVGALALLGGVALLYAVQRRLPR